MANISYAGAFVAGALQVPDVYLNVLPPNEGVIRPATVGVLGYVGVASWGPIGSPSTIGGIAELNTVFGYPTVRSNDLPTAAVVALEEQGAAGTGAELQLCRVSDGTDTAASVLVQTASSSNYALSLTAYYTGVAGNKIRVQIAAGSKVGTWKAIITMPPFAPQAYDNISGSGATFWQNLANAINYGSGLSSASTYVIASAGTGANATATPVAASYSLSGGADGGTPNSAHLVGQDVLPRTGVYAFRGSGISDLNVVDLCDPTQESTLVTFSQSEGIYVHLSGPPGETPTAAAAAKATAGTDNPWVKRWLGDWIVWQDNYNQTSRMLAPGTVGAAMMSCVPVMLTTLNQRSYATQATQRSGIIGNGLGSNAYGADELATLVGNGIDVITNPIPAGNMFGGRIGQNASSNGAINGDNWPRLTSFLARSLAGPGALGTLIGKTITDQFFQMGYDMLDAFLAPFKRPGNGPQVIQDYQIQFSRQNNPQDQTARGIVVAQVLIQYLGIARVFLVNLQTGQTVVIRPQDVAAANAATVPVGTVT